MGIGVTPTEKEGERRREQVRKSERVREREKVVGWSFYMVVGRTASSRLLLHTWRATHDDIIGY